MIIDNTYFKNEIYIPHAKPSVTDSVTAVEGDILDFINEYARQCLLSCLGRQLFYEFEKELDPAQANGLKAGADAKWNALLNGLEYQNPADETVVWRGIRWKSKPTGEYDRSLLAYYTYFYYEKHDYVTRSDVGHVQENAKNAWSVNPREKVVNAWNKFVDLAQGKQFSPQPIVKWGGLVGVDYASNYTGDVSLYEFINDQNALTEDKYAGFSGRAWERLNSVGL